MTMTAKALLQRSCRALAACGAVIAIGSGCGSETVSPSEDGGVQPGTAGDGAGSGGASDRDAGSSGSSGGGASGASGGSGGASGGSGGAGGGSGGAGGAGEFDCGRETCGPGVKCCVSTGTCDDPNDGTSCGFTSCASPNGAPVDYDACCGPLGLVGCPATNTCVHPDCAECCPPQIDCNQHDECPDGYSCCYGTRRCYHPAVEDCTLVPPRCDDDGGCPGDLTCSSDYEICYPPGPHPGLSWHFTCGYPVCGNPGLPDVADDPETPNCTTEQEGDSCMVPGAVCDGVGSCGSMLACTEAAPVVCPISRARYKRGIRYVDDQQRHALAEELLSIPLASYSYRNDPRALPQLGFIIEDVEPSAVVQGDRVNLYGYLSMAVAALQVQDTQLRSLQSEVAALRARLEATSGARCGP
jgi:hypothetical protein